VLITAVLRSERAGPHTVVGVQPNRTKPLVCVSGRRWTGSRIVGLPDNFAELAVDLHIGAYADSIEAAGGLAVLAPCTDRAVDVVDRCDALVLSGGADVDPSFYGEPAHESVANLEPARDRVEIAMARRALGLGIPILAVCRGMQVLNVALDGTLVQHLDGSQGIEHAAWDLSSDSLVHDVRFAEGSLAASTFGVSCVVNSLHHQAIRTLGTGLVATGWSNDGCVEAAEIADRFVLAVQWHPELVRTGSNDPFGWLVDCAMRVRTSRRSHEVQAI
jgi:putative glutamine amidotransferase